ncbi:hypothetical protein Acsp03_49980 [Actinomadura sp. NBRC 104412]|uniref:hypothetical protein n=1 Tax=Actinomadura sp. NBRC 104412 TaxID=3032203 RepID=UPI0024A3CA72|nr:hypothetical protein [Actinomadura sp. NBRC 104412]GLZ07532.1 hypothetical protein Acsp03_49980 [Actinomadura sp. NBRC 104412]
MTRRYAPLPIPDPTSGTVVLSPERPEAGYWVGCPSVLYERGRFWLTYRQRRPRGATDERGWRCAVAVSDDGQNFTDVWSVHKDELGTSSMERFCLTATDDDRYRLFVSYVDPADKRWRIDAMTAGSPSEFDVAEIEPVLTAESTGTEGVKDPYVVRVGPVTYLFASYAAACSDLGLDAHATADIYNVGVTTHPTGLATSVDGVSFRWHGQALAVGEGWDRYQARLNSVVPTPGGWVGFYDGSASHTENYEERCGIAVSGDLHNWRRVTHTQAWLASPWRTGSVRYMEVLLLDGQWWLYYELTRADGAHELRLAKTPAV